MLLFFYLLSAVFVGVGAMCPSEPHARRHMAVVPNKYYYEWVNGSLRGIFSNPYRPGEAEAILLGNTTLPRASKRFVSWTFGGSQREANTTTIITSAVGNATSGAMVNATMAGRGPAWVRRGGMHGRSMPRPSHTLPTPKPYKPFMGLWAKTMNATAVEVEEEGEGEGWEPPHLSVVPAAVSKPNVLVVLGGLWLAAASGGVSRGGSSAPLLSISPQQLRGAARAVMSRCRGMVRALVGVRARGGFKGQPLKRLLTIRGGAAAAGYYGSVLTWGIGAAIMAALAYDGVKLYHEHWGAGQATIALPISGLQPIAPSLASIANSSIDHATFANATCTPRPARATPRPAKAENGRWLWKEGSMFEKADQLVQWRAPLLHTCAFTSLPTTGLPLPLSLPSPSLLSRAKQAFIKSPIFNNARALVLVDSPPVMCHTARAIERPIPSVILHMAIVPRMADAPSLRAFLAYFMRFFLSFLTFALVVWCLDTCRRYVLRAFARRSLFKVGGPSTCLTKDKADTYQT